ncbi:MAG: SLC13 family permease [Xanthomonadales bacterium]|nr:SLC13 family permease [Xanthomonadales bacterium]
MCRTDRGRDNDGMTLDIMVVLVLLLTAMILFAVEWFSVDVVTWLLLAALVLTGVLTPGEAFSGFASEIIVVLGSVFVISGALVKTGVMDWLARLVQRWTRGRESRLTATIMSISAFASAFFSNTSATALLMPATRKAALATRIAPGRLLMPLAYASILGGSCTLIGTSTNMAGSSLMASLGLQPFGVFEFTLAAGAVAIAGVLYMVTLGRHLIPQREKHELVDDYGIPDFLSQLLIPDGSPAIGQALGRLRLSEKDITPVAILRGRQRLKPHGLRKLQGGDLILVRAPRDALLRFQDASDFQIESPAVERPADLSIAEAVLTPQSRLIGQSLKQLDFYRVFGLTVLAIFRRGHAYPKKIDNLPLKVGDVLLLEGATADLERLQGDRDLWGLMAIEPRQTTHRQGLWAVAALGAAVAASALGVLPMAIAFLLAALALVLGRAITPEQAYQFVEWRLIVLIGGMTSFGLAMQKTGAADLLATSLVDWTQPLGVYATLASLSVLAVVLTQPMSNAAAVLVLLPVALAAAEVMAVDPRSVAVLVTLSASLSFITPLEPASLLVYGPGKYHFRDFMIAGLPLTVISIALLLLLVPLLWPLQG